MRKWSVVAAFIIAATLSSYSVGRLFEIHKADKTTQFSRLFFVPETVAQLTSVGIPGVVADYLMLNLLVIHGEKLLNEIPMTTEEWQKTYQGLLQITALDPSFQDPYVFAEMSLPWDAGMVKETNFLLLRAAKYRSEDYRPYFFLWFNYFYFLKDPRTAALYMQKSARKPGAPRYYASLAARMNLYGGDTLNGIVFLREMIANTNDPGRLHDWKIRLECLEKIAFLEGKIVKYVEQVGSKPQSLKDLIGKGLLKEIPDDPYGGTFFINEFGRVYTTSKMSYATVKKEK